MTPAGAGTPGDDRTTVPAGWLTRGSRPDDYDFGTTSLADPARKVAFIRSRPEPGGFGTLMQTFRADAYCGTRQVLSARIRAEDVESWAGLWMRVDGPGAETLAFDNMEARPIRGTTNWAEYRVVLDVPREAVHVALGVLLNGPGSVWIDAVSLTEAADDVPTTGPRSSHPAGPTNLDFTE